MEVNLTRAKAIISANTDLIGCTYFLPGGDEMVVHEFRLLSHTAEKGSDMVYSVVALLKNPDYNSNVQFYVSLESVLLQAEARYNNN